VQRVDWGAWARKLLFFKLWPSDGCIGLVIVRQYISAKYKNSSPKYLDFKEEFS
jgi:hypothetical protein